MSGSRRTGSRPGWPSDRGVRFRGFVFYLSFARVFFLKVKEKQRTSEEAPIFLRLSFLKEAERRGRETRESDSRPTIVDIKRKQRHQKEKDNERRKMRKRERGWKKHEKPRRFLFLYPPSMLVLIWMVRRYWTLSFLFYSLLQICSRGDGRKRRRRRDKNSLQNSRGEGLRVPACVFLFSTGIYRHREEENKLLSQGGEELIRAVLRACIGERRKPKK